MTIVYDSEQFDYDLFALIEHCSIREQVGFYTQPVFTSERLEIRRPFRRIPSDDVLLTFDITDRLTGETVKDVNPTNIPQNWLSHILDLMVRYDEIAVSNGYGLYSVDRSWFLDAGFTLCCGSDV